MRLPRITVITPSYNQGETLEQTIRSVLEQNYPHLEYMVIDGGSQDESPSIIRRYQHRLAYWVSEKDRGQSHAINKGFARASGDLLAWLNSDDFYLPGALACIAQAYQAHPTAGLYTGNGLLVDKEGKTIRRYANDVGFDFSSLLQGSCYVLQPATFINRAAFEQAGFLDETLHFGMDLEYWLRVGKSFPVVVVDEPLAAFRWYEEVKTNQGFARWVELWEIYRRYTDQEITPGLLVEFFATLKKKKVLEDLGMEAADLAEAGFSQAYARMQKALNLNDCIPSGRGVRFCPAREGEAPARPQPVAPPVLRSAGSRPRLDLVLQATGSHAWGVSGGWANAARQLGLLHRVFSPRAEWGQAEASDDDGLFAYLANPQADLILLLGFDWHSQMLHASPRWQERWASARIVKVLYAHESIESSCRLFGNDLLKQAALSALNCVDACVYADLADEAFFRAAGKPALFQPFGVDETVFSSRQELLSRTPRAFFRGKTTPFFNDQTYSLRREYIRHLLENGLLDVLEYRDRPVPAEEIAADFNRYRIAVNFPSVFSNHPTRVYEALACGCALLTNLTGTAPIDALFEHRRHLLYYADKDELAAGIRELAVDDGLARKLAAQGRQHVLERFTLEKHLKGMVDWLAQEKPARRAASLAAPPPAPQPGREKIVIDGVIFQLQQNSPGGISRVWKALLRELAGSELAERIVLLDRGSTAPAMPGLARWTIQPYDYRYFEDDPLYLQDLCEQVNAGLFLSTYYTFPENLHSLLMLHDMVPEVRGEDLSLPEWRAKAKAIERASAYLCVSASTCADFRRLYPQHAGRKAFVTPNAVSEDFKVHSEGEIARFRKRRRIEKPYFMLVGNRLQYKNALLFFRAFSLLEDKDDYEILCTGGAAQLEDLFLPYVRGVRHQVLYLEDEELSTALSGAIALVYPSQYEGFGLPVLEAMRSGCPVITCPGSSLAEVGGEAPRYVEATDVGAMLQALREVQQPEVRARMIAQGLEQAGRFSWAHTCQKIVAAIREVSADLQGAALHPGDPLNTGGRLIYALERKGQFPELVAALQRLRKMYTGWLRYDHAAILQSEERIARMEAEALAVLQQAFAADEECDAFLHYWYGLVLARRGQAQEALAAFLTALRRHNWVAGYRWRLADLAAGMADRLGDLPLAARLLEDIVLAEHPAYAEAQKRLLRIRQAQATETAAGRARRPGDNGRSKADPLSPAAGRLSRGPARAGAVGEPLVSAIVSCYNSARFLRACLDDLEAQTIADRLEIIVVDSGSQQREGEMVRKYRERYGNIVYLRTEERESVYAAWNRAIQVARGRYLTNANTDDRHLPQALEVLAGALEAHPEAGVAYADCAVTRKENTSLDRGPICGRFRWPDFDRRALFRACFVGPQPMWRRSLHERFGLFDASFASAGDYEFWLRISAEIGFLHLPQVLGLYLISPGGLEHRDAARSIQEAERARALHWNPAEGPRPPAGGNYLEWYASPPAGAAQDFPLVSVVVPTFNRPAELRAALLSVLEQTYPNLEIVVVNDGGADVSGVIQSLGQRRPVRCEVHPENRGAGAARNTGLQAAAGKYVAFLDDDDAYHPEHLFALVAELEANPQLAAAYSDARQVTVDSSGRKPRLLERRVLYSRDFDPAELLVRNYIPILCLAARREALAQAGPFDARMPALEDWEWLIRLSQAGPFGHLPFVTAEYVVRKGGLSRNMLTPDQIRRLYLRLYTAVAPLSGPAVRAAQRRFYAQMTGRDLAQEAPDLFAPQAPPKANLEAASETLALLLEAEDLPQALEEHADRLDEDLYALVRLNADTARADGQLELAEGLEDLAEYVKGVLHRQRQATE